MRIILSLILTVFFSKICYAEIGKETGLKIPRYVSLKSNEANIRVGPSMNYPITVKYIQKSYPLKITEEYDDWRKIEDSMKNIGWIHKSLISGNNNNNYINGLYTIDNNNNIITCNNDDKNIISNNNDIHGCENNNNW